MNKMNVTRRVIAALLCLTLLLGPLPVSVFAGNDETPDPTKAEKLDTPPCYEAKELTSSPSFLLQLVVGEDGYKETIRSGGSTVKVDYVDKNGASASVTVELATAYMQLFHHKRSERVNEGKGSEKLILSNQRINQFSAYELNSVAFAFTGSYVDGIFNTLQASMELEPYASYSFALNDLPVDLRSITSVSLQLKENDSLSLQSLRIIKPSYWSWNDGYLDNYFNGTVSNQLEGIWSGKLVAKASGQCVGKATTTFSVNSVREAEKLTWYGTAGEEITNYGDGCGFSMHVADIPTAGIVSLLAGFDSMVTMAMGSSTGYYSGRFESKDYIAYRAYANLDPIFEEIMTLEVTYLDVLGDTRKVNIPVLTSYLVQILCDNLGRLAGPTDDHKTYISGIFQQNETVALYLKMAQFESLVGLQLIYGEAPKGMTRTGWAEKIDTNQDTLTVDRMEFYTDVASNAFYLRYDPVKLACVLNTDMTASYSYSSTNPDGAELATGHRLNVTLDNKKLVEGPAVQKPLENTYVFSLVNSSVEQAGTYNGIYMDITYVDVNGFEHVLSGLSLKELVGRFCGYTCNHDSLLWKQLNGVGPGQGYYLGDYEMDLYMQYWESLRHPGMTTQFMLTINNVAYFKSITFTIRYEVTQQEVFLSGSKGIDDWQLNQVKVTKATSIGQRYSEGRLHRPEQENEGYSAFPRWQREVQGEDIAWSNQKMLLQSGVQTQTLYLNYIDENGNVVKPETAISEEKYPYEIPTSMTYEMALRELGYTVPKYTYNVSVEVGSMADAGSTNYFYFQLIFENGTSAVVLANQQLSSDSFRQGAIETFRIQTTQNYGKLKSVRIICDSAASTSNVFDKLNVSKISVQTEGSSGVNRVWEIANIGWIDINYSDEGTLYNPGNTDVIVPVETSNVQLVREYPVTGISTAVDLLFCINTSQKSGTMHYNNDRTDGEIHATLIYLDSIGARKEMELNLTELLFTFNETTELTWLYRPNHTDRFLLAVPDISSVLGLLIERTGGKNEWVVDSITVQQVGGIGNVYISYNREYIRDFASAVELARNEDTDPVFIGGDDACLFNFTANTISVSQTDDQGWDASITREPDTTNDTLNIYLYSGSMTKKDYPFTSQTAIKGTVQYFTRYGGAMQSSFTFQMGTVDGKNVMYVEGVKVDGMSTFTALRLSDQNKTPYQTVVSYAVVERVRDDVIIETYCLTYDNFLDYVDSSEPGKESVNPMRQYVTLQSGAGQDRVLLTEETYDVAVALRYTSASALDGMQKVYRSPYIYLTDQQIMALSSSENVELVFEVDNIDTILGLTVVTTGPVFQYDGVQIINREAKSDYVLQSYHSTESFYISNIESKIDVSAGQVSTAVFSFTTPPNSQVAGAGTSGLVSMQITYTNSAGEQVRYTFDDLNSRLPAGTSFGAGITVQLSVPLPDAVSVDKVTLYVLDDEWYLSAVSVDLTLGNGLREQKSVKVENWVKDLTPLEIDMNAVSSAITELRVQAASRLLQRTTQSGGISTYTVSVLAGDEITLTPGLRYTGSPDTSLSWNLGQWAMYCTRQPKDVMIFRVPADAAVNDSYTLKVESVEDPNFYVTVVLQVTEYDSLMEVSYKTHGTGEKGTMHNGDVVYISAYTHDILQFVPTYLGKAQRADQWKWEIPQNIGSVYIDPAGELEWSLNNQVKKGDTFTLHLIHKDTGERVTICVTIEDNVQVQKIRVTAVTDGTGESVDSKDQKTVYINAYTDDYVTITPYYEEQNLAYSAWIFERSVGDYGLGYDQNGSVTIRPGNMNAVDSVLMLKVIHKESGESVMVVITMVGRQVNPDAITLTSEVESTGKVQTASAGQVLQIQVTSTDTVTMVAKVNGQVVSDDQWQINTWEDYYQIIVNNGKMHMSTRRNPAVGMVLTATLTHVPSGYSIVIEFIVDDFDTAENPLSLWCETVGVGEYGEIQAGQTLRLNAWSIDHLYITPSVNGSTTTKKDWSYTCSVNIPLHEHVGTDGMLSLKLDRFPELVKVGDEIVITVTHVESGQAFTVILTIIDF